jgi:hypothetical protein
MDKITASALLTKLQDAQNVFYAGGGKAVEACRAEQAGGSSRAAVRQPAIGRWAISWTLALPYSQRTKPIPQPVPAMVR